MRLKNYEEPKTVRTKFYYIRKQDESKFPVVTVCLKYDPTQGIVTRGIAVCAMGIEKEQRRKKKAGRGIAETRAKWAMVNYRRNLSITTKAIEKMDYAAMKFISLNHIAWMCDHDPTLTAHEEEILGLTKAPCYTVGPKIDPVKNGWIRKLAKVIKNRLNRDQGGRYGR